MEGTGMISGVPARQEGRKLWQYIASISASIMAVAAGCALAWSSPVLPQLYKEDSWLVISEIEGSWVGSLLPLGAMFGAVPFGLMADKVGRRKSFLLLTVPYLLSWAIIIFASKLWLIDIARFVVGIGVGAACILVPIYMSEIAEVSIRGLLGALFQLFLTIGILLSFILGSVLSYTMFALICGLMVVGFLIAFPWMPESPVWLVNQGRKSEATLAMAVLRSDSYDPSEELAEMQREAEQAASKSSVFDIVSTAASRKALIALLGGMLFQQLSGVNGVVFYTFYIFKASGSTIPEDVASIIVAFVQVVMSAVAALIADRVGRRPLLMFSSGVMSVSLIALGWYFHLLANEDDVSRLNWLPLTSLTLFMIAFSVGLGPVPWMLMGELLSVKIKPLASGIAVSLNWFLVFLVTKTFPTMTKELGMDTTFWIFAAIMVIATVFTYFFVPETKGKSMQEIQEELQNGVLLKSMSA